MVEPAAFLASINSITISGTTYTQGQKILQAYVPEIVTANTANLTQGQSYKIVTLGTTNFSSIGAGSTPAPGQVFVLNSTTIVPGSDGGTVAKQTELINLNTEARA